MGRIGYKLLADFFMVVHLAWIGVLLGGTVYIFFNQAYVKYHLIIVSGTLFFNLILGGCPLTWWEEKCRKIWDPRTYYHPNSFLVTYVHKLFSKDITPQQINWTLIGIKISSYTVSALLLTGVL